MGAGAINHLTALGLLIAVPIVVAALLRWARAPGWPVLGGLLAGMLLGPTILGRVAPRQYEDWFVGGRTERVSRDDLARTLDRERFVALNAGVASDRLRAMDAAHEPQLRAAAQVLHEARWHDQRSLRALAAIVVALVLLGSATRHVRHRDRRQGLVAPVTIGLWAALLPGMIAFAVAWRLWPHDLATALLAGAAMSIGPWALGEIDREAADQAEFGGAHMIQRAGRVASAAGLAAVAGALLAAGSSAAAAWAAPLAALPIAWLLPHLKSPALMRVIDAALLPVACALIMVRIDVIEHLNVWMIVVFMVLAGDGRWIGALLGALIMGGRSGLRTMRLVTGAMSCGPTMLAVTAVGVYSGLLPGAGVGLAPGAGAGPSPGAGAGGESIALALVLSAALIEVTTPARRAVVRRLVETEREIEEIGHDG